MQYLLLLMLVFLCSCESHSFEKDKRQLIAKNEIIRKLGRVRTFDITGFTEDTLKTYPDTIIHHPLRYQLDISYTDTLGQLQKKMGEVVFTNDGNSVVSTDIIDQH